MKNKNILKIIVLILLFIGMFFVNKEYDKNRVLIFNNYETELPGDSEFSISFWIRPKNNSSNNEILKLIGNGIDIYLLNSTEEAQLKQRGITLLCNTGFVLNRDEATLNTEEWSNIVVCVDNKSIQLYLDGKKIIDKRSEIQLNDKRIKLNISNKFEYENIKYSSYVLNKEEILVNFEENIDYKFKSLEFSKIYPSTAAKYYLNKSSFPVVFKSESKSIEFGDNFFTLKGNNSDRSVIHNIKAKITINNKDYYKELSLEQNGNSENSLFLEEVQKINNLFNYYLSVSDILEFNNELKVDCKVISGNAKFDNEKKTFIKTDNAKEREPITIKCEIRKGNQYKSFTKNIILLDEYDGYLMVFFNGEDGWPDHLTGTESIYFAYSKDLTHWKVLSKRQILKTNKGSGRFRDPYISRDKNGSFIITSTEGYYYPSIYIIKSDDLKKFEVLNPVISVFDKTLGLSGERAWAPEFIYNQEEDIYTILFSEGKQENNGIYAVNTKDFINFSYPYVYLQTGCNSIDADVVLIEGKYYLFYKDERDDKKNIHYAVSNSISNPVWVINDEINLNGTRAAEGPFAIKKYDSNEYKMFIDCNTSANIYSGEIKVTNRGIKAQLSEDKILTDSVFAYRHFSIIPITKKEHTNIVNTCK